jgi:hypothetical protein
MADIDPKQQHLDDHYGDLQWTLVDEPSSGEGMSPAQAGSFLRGLRPVARVAQSLREAAKKVTHTP